MRHLLEHLFDASGPYLSMMTMGLAGLTDEEYLWEPVDNCWSVRPVAELRTPRPAWAAPGDWSLEIAYPDPQPSPFTTIAWRMSHMTGSVDVATATLRGRRREDGAIDGAWSADAPDTARTADDAARHWHEAIARLQEQLAGASDADLQRAERQWWDAPDSRSPVWQQVIYYAYFEPVSHGAEVRLVRDLYRHTSGGANPLRQVPE